VKCLISLFFLSTCAFANGQSSDAGDTSFEFKIINRGSYSIRYPKNWTVDRTGLMGADLVILSQKDSDSDKFRENVNVMVQDLKGLNMDIEKYVDISTRQIKNLLTKANIIESTRIHQQGNEFHKLIFTGVQGIFSLKTEQYYFVVNEKAFVITFTTEESSYDSYRKTGEMILQSFEPKK
jgi:hypothetical protein